MNKANSAKRLLALIIYAAELILAIFIGVSIFARDVVFDDAAGLLFTIGIILVPLVIATFLLFSAIEEENKRYRVVKALLYAIFVLYGLVLFSLLYKGFRPPMAWGAANMGIADYLRFGSNFIPFKTITSYISYFIKGTVNNTTIFKNLIGNLLIFAPMGLLLPCLFKSLRRFTKFIIVMLIMLIGVEVGQLLSFTGNMDIDDVILNLLGAVLFYGLGKVNLCQRFLRRIYILD